MRIVHKQKNGKLQLAKTIKKIELPICLNLLALAQ
jgi:hypothetical protein